jgi:hypothetical protein
MKANKLPKPASSATDDELKAYLAQFNETGDRRVLAVEILRLRDIIRNWVGEHALPDGNMLVTPKPERKAPKEKDEDIF